MAFVRGVAPLVQFDHHAAFGALRRLIGGRVFQLGEVVVVGAVVDVHLGLERIATARAVVNEKIMTAFACPLHL